MFRLCSRLCRCRRSVGGLFFGLFECMGRMWFRACWVDKSVKNEFLEVLGDKCIGLKLKSEMKSEMKKIAWFY